MAINPSLMKYSTISEMQNILMNDQNFMNGQTKDT